MAEWAYKKKGIKSAYVLEDQTIEYSKSGCAGFRSAWKKLGGTLERKRCVQKRRSLDRCPDYAHQIGFASAPEAIYLCSFTPGGASAIRQVRAAGIESPILANVGMTDDYWLGAVPNLSNFLRSDIHVDLW